MSAAEPIKPWTARVLTLFPAMFPGPLGFSLAGRALEKGLWSLECLCIRDFAENRHRTVDGAPAGGGAGMIMRPDVLGEAVDAALERPGAAEQPLIYLSPRGRPLTQARVRELAESGGASLICGRFEGVDERLLEARSAEEISLGDFVLSGGEPAAIALLDAVIRLLPGVVGDAAALEEESFSDGPFGGLLEYPQYTRPQEWEGMPIPEILRSGDHARIEEWRRAQAEELTKERRPDLWRRYAEKKNKPRP